MGLKTFNEIEDLAPESQDNNEEFKQLSAEQLGEKLVKHLPERKDKKNIREILDRKGLSIENLVIHMSDLLNSQDERVRKDIIIEGLTMHGVRNPEENLQPTINLVIQDGDVKVQNILLPKRD